MERKGWLAFDYKKETDIFTKISKHRPMLPLRLKHGNALGEIVEALIDSGAEDTIFTAELAEELGVKLLKTKSKQLRGFGKSSVTGYPAKVDLLVDGFREFIAIDVFFVQDLSIAGILGHDFFCNFDVLFSLQDNTFSVRKARTLED